MRRLLTVGGTLVVAGCGGGEQDATTPEGTNGGAGTAGTTASAAGGATSTTSGSGTGGAVAGPVTPDGYALSGDDEELSIGRFTKSGGDLQYVFPHHGGVHWLANDALPFSRFDESREFELVCSVDLDGNNPTVYGYLPSTGNDIAFLAADANYVYATKDFVMARFRR